MVSIYSSRGTPTVQRHPPLSPRCDFRWLCWDTMKLLFISLALAIFAGSQAVVIREAPHQAKQTKLSEVIHELEEFLEELSNATEKRFEQFKHSKTGQALLKFLEEEEAEEKETEKDLKNFEDAIDAAIDIVADFAEIVQKAVVELGKEVRPAFKRFDEAVEAAVGAHLDPVIERLEPQVGHLLHDLVNKTHELDHKLGEIFAQQLEILDTHAPQYIQKLQEQETQQKAARK